MTKINAICTVQLFSFVLADYLHLVITLHNPSLALTEKVLYKTYSPGQKTP